MLRKLVDYKKLDRELGALLIETYSDGYGDDDIIVFKNLKGETVEAVELKTKDTIYLVKISKSLSNFIANFEENIEKELEKVTLPVDTENQNYDLDGESEFKAEDQD